MLLTLSLIAQLGVPDACTELAKTYEEIEYLGYAGQDVSELAPKLLLLADACGKDPKGRRSALESYFLVFEQLKTANDKLPLSLCSSLRQSRELAAELTVAHPNNGRLREIQGRLNGFAAKSECAIEVPQAQPVAPVQEPGESDDLDLVEGPDADKGGSRSTPMKQAAIATGVVSGAALFIGGLTTGLAVAESHKVEARLKEDQPQGLAPSTNVCRMGAEEVGTSYCGKLNRLKVTSVVSWSVFSASALSAVVLGVLHRRRHNQRSARVMPQFGLSETRVTLGALVHF